MTDRERCLVLEARLSVVEAELAEYRRLDLCSRSSFAQSPLEPIRSRLRNAYPPAGGQMIAIMLQAFLDASPRPVSRDHLFAITRERHSWAQEEGDRKGIDVQICKLRKALAIMGYPAVIQTMNGQGWLIDPAQRDQLKASLGLG